MAKNPKENPTSRELAKEIGGISAESVRQLAEAKKIDDQLSRGQVDQVRAHIPTN